jgi:hypothetical protein
VTLVFSGGERLLYECKVQVDPISLGISDNRLYVAPTRLVFELDDEPVSVELSEVMELRLDSAYGERFIFIRFKNLSGINTITFVCTGFGGIISNISKTMFVYKLVSRLRSGRVPMDRDIRLLMSGSTIELYAPWTLLTLMLVTLAAGVVVPLQCWSRLLGTAILLLSFLAFSFTEVYRLLLGRLRWPVIGVVCTFLFSALAVIGARCVAT